MCVSPDGAIASYMNVPNNEQFPVENTYNYHIANYITNYVKSFEGEKFAVSLLVKCNVENFCIYLPTSYVSSFLFTHKNILCYIKLSQSFL